MTKDWTGRALQLSLEFWPFTWNTRALASKNLGSQSLCGSGPSFSVGHGSQRQIELLSPAVWRREIAGMWGFKLARIDSMNVLPLWRPKTYTPATSSHFGEGTRHMEKCVVVRSGNMSKLFLTTHLAVKEFLVHVIFHLRERKHFPKWRIARSLVLTKTPKWCQKPIAQQSQYPLELCGFCHPVNWWPLLLTYCSHFWQEKQYLSGGEAAEAPSGGYVIVEPTNRKIWW